jgi:O-antigen/teichoic acid export membrane protein
MLAKILGPGILGTWTQMKLGFLFLVYSDLGTSDAMLREVPYAVGRNDLLRAERIKRTTLGFTLMVSSCLVILFFIYILIPGERAWKSLRSEWFLFAVVFLVSQVYWYSIIRLQSEKRIGRSGIMLLYFAISSTVMGAVGANYFGLGGFLVALGISYLLVLAWGESLSSYQSPSLDFALLRDLIRKGFPIMGSVALLMLLWNIDKIMIGLLMNTRDLGIYSLQSYITNMLMILPHSVATVLYPGLMEKIGRIKEKKTLEGYLTQPTLTMGYLICPLLGVIFLTIHLPIQWMLPQYIQAIVPGQIIVLAVFFMILAKMPVMILVSLNKQNLLLLLTAVSVLSGIAADTLLIKTGFGLIGVSVGTAISFVVYSSLTTYYAMNEIGISKKKSGSFLSLAFAPYVFLCFVICLTQYSFPKTISNWKSDLFYTSIESFSIMIIMAVLYFLLDHSFHLFRQIKTHE